MKRQPMKWKEILANHLSDKELVSGIFKEFLEHKRQVTQYRNGQRICIDYFFRGSIQIANKHMKRYQHHLSLDPNSLSKPIIKIQMRTGVEAVEKRTCIHCWRNVNNTATLEKSVWQFLKILKRLFDPTILLLGIYPREMKIYIHQKLIHNCS